MSIPIFSDTHSAYMDFIDQIAYMMRAGVHVRVESDGDGAYIFQFFAGGDDFDTFSDRLLNHLGWVSKDKVLCSRERHNLSISVRWLI